MTYPIHERFRAFQGEGVHMGRPAFFIRTFGCPISCPWCDSAGTWHKDWVPDDIPRMHLRNLVEEALQEPRVEFVVITGGEPTVHNLQPLVHELHEHQMPVHLETSGAFEIKAPFDWITLSPKKWKMPLDSSIWQADEFKVIVEFPEDIPFYTDALEQSFTRAGSRIPVPIWLHPEWSHREDPVVLKAIVDAVVNGRGLYRAGWQIHKGYRVDQQDNRVRPAVPLGGQPEKGF